MLSKNEVLSLRDLALGHLPDVVIKRDEAAKHSRNAALQAVALSPLLTHYNPASKVTELIASEILLLVGKHPESLTWTLTSPSIEWDDGIGITEEMILSDANSDRELIEELLMQSAKELCHLTGESLPPWISLYAEILRTERPIPSNSEAPTTATNDTPAPKPGITTKQAGDAFGGLVPNLQKKLADGPKWIAVARISRGTPGGKHQASWCPILLAHTIYEKNRVPKPKINKIFHDNSFLSNWRDVWTETAEDLR